MQIEKKEIPLVSVILCVYNRRNTITNALASIINQTFKDYEVIVVDDGSTDKVEEIIIPYLKQNDNFKYIRHSNRHTAYSRNTGLLIAQGRYVTFLDSDDKYREKHLENMVNLLSGNPELDLVYSDPVIVGDKEVQDNKISIRSRKKGDMGSLELDIFINQITNEILTKEI